MNHELQLLLQHHRVNGEQAFQRETAKFDPSQNQNPLTALYKIVNIWLRPRDYAPISTFVKISSTGVSGESGEI